MRIHTDFECRATKAAADFHAAQKAFFAVHRAVEQRRCEVAAQHPFVIDLRKRLYAVYETDTLPEAVRVQAYALWSAAEPYVWLCNTPLPLVETGLRPEFPEVHSWAILHSWLDKSRPHFHPEDAERRSGWLRRVDEWLSRVERLYGIVGDEI